jgi:hypothetical protein
MSTTSQGYVSIIGTNMLDSVVQLVETLESLPLAEPNEVQTNQLENGYSCALIVLAVVVLESVVNRTKYIRQDSNKNDIHVYIAIITGETELAKDVDEAIAVRDAIVHNHIWEAKTYWDDQSNLKFSSPPRLLAGFGNRRLRRVVNMSTRLSHRMKLNLFPPRIWRRDAYLILRVVEQTPRCIETKDRNYCYFSQHSFMFRGMNQPLSNILNALKQ